MENLEEAEDIGYDLRRNPTLIRSVIEAYDLFLLNGNKKKFGA